MKKSIEISKGPLAFLFFNHYIIKEELEYQINELKAKGFSGFFIHPRDGLLTPYMSKEWFDIVSFAIQYAKKVGLEAWLYDEDPYPSGIAGGKVVWENPDYAASVLLHSKVFVEKPGVIELDLPKGKLIGAFIVDKSGIKRIDEYAGIVRKEWEVFLHFVNYYPPFTAEGIPHWRAITSSPNYRIKVEVKHTPAYVLGFVKHYFTDMVWGAYVDTMNQKAIETFIKFTHKEYYKRFSKEFCKTVPGVFTDEPKVIWNTAWSDCLEAIFAEITGKKLTDSLPHLVLDIDKDTLFVRWAYREAISRAFKSAFIDQISRYCKKTSLIFTGHISPEEDPIGQAYMAPGIMSWISEMDMPGVDIIATEIGDRRHPLLHLGPKIGSSSAHTVGKNDILCEAFGCVDWTAAPAFLGKITNWLYALGINRICVHGQSYSIDGLRKKEAPPSLFIQASFWKHFKAISQYIEQLSSELTKGWHSAPVALYYPEESFMALATADNNTESIKQAEKIRDSFAVLMHKLLTNGYDFDLIDSRIIKQAKVVDQKLKIAKETYSALIIPNGYILKSTADSLAYLTKQGVKIIGLSKTLPIIEGNHYKPPLVKDEQNIVKALKAMIPPIIEAEGELIAHKRITKEGIKLFVINNGDKPFCGTIKPDFTGPYEIKDLNCKQSFIATTLQNVEILPDRAILVSSARSKSSLKAYVPTSQWKNFIDLSNDWSIQPLSDNCCVLRYFKWMSSQEKRSISYDEIVWGKFVDLLAPVSITANEKFLYFLTSFNCHNYKDKLTLVRDSDFLPSANPQSLAFYLNGTELDFERKRYYDLFNLAADITKLLKDGRNYLLIQWEIPEKYIGKPIVPYDAVRLFGNFHLTMPFGEYSPPCLSPRKLDYNLNEQTDMGHPYYGGLLSYKKKVLLDKIPFRLAISFEHIYDTAEIFINGVSAGILWQPPWFMEINPKLFKEGKNELEVQCSTSPAKYILAQNKPFGFTPPIRLMQLC